MGELKLKEMKAAPPYLTKRIENICSHKILYMNAHSSIAHKNKQKSRNNPNVHELMNG